MDEAAFSALVDELSPAMLRVARAHVPTDAAAEDVVQEAWMVVIRRLDDFEGRSSISTWVLGIVINVARNTRRRDARALPFSAVGSDDDNDAGIDPDRFLPADHPQWPGHWAIAPTAWPPDALETAEALATIRATIAALPDTQREVITLRDLVGCSAEEVRNALGLSDTNQRVLLHRARTKVRAALERLYDATEDLM